MFAASPERHTRTPSPDQVISLPATPGQVTVTPPPTSPGEVTLTPPPATPPHERFDFLFFKI